MVSTTDNAWEKQAEAEEKKERKAHRRARWDYHLVTSRWPVMRVIKGFLFPRAKKRFSERNLTKLDAEETKAFLRLMEEPIVYNEALTAALEAHDKQVTSKWSKKN